MHTTQIVNTKVISDESVAVLIRCCNDPSTDSWHTLQVSAATAAADVTAWQTDALTAVQNKHAARNNAGNLLTGLQAVALVDGVLMPAPTTSA